MISIIKRNKSYAVVCTNATGEKKRQKCGTYYSLDKEPGHRITIDYAFLLLISKGVRPFFKLMRSKL